MIGCSSPKTANNMSKEDRHNQKLASLEIKYDLSDSNSEKLIDLNIGALNLPSGQIIASDPFFTRDAKPFVKQVNPGVYPVNISLLKINEGHHRIAFARIKFKPEKATTWSLAITEGAKISQLKRLKADEYFGFPVDAGLGCFLDEKTNEVYERKCEEFERDNPGKNYYVDILVEEFAENAKGSPYSSSFGDWNNHLVDEKDNLNIIMFSSGWGDGSYPTYWGTNDKNEIVELVIDFMLGVE